MNKERILEIADIIEKQPHVPMSAESGFNMFGYFHPCGTPSCIAGWILETYSSGRPSPHSYARVAAELIDLPFGCRDVLFDPQSYVMPNEYGYMLHNSDITPAHAAAVLRNLVATGYVDWDVDYSEESADVA